MNPNQQNLKQFDGNDESKKSTSNSSIALELKNEEIEKWSLKKILNAAANFITTYEKFISLCIHLGAVIVAAWLLNKTYDQINISRDVAHKQLRAYIVAIEPKLDSIKIGKRLEMTFVIRNDGQTPAYDVCDSLYIEIRDIKLGPRMPASTRSSHQMIYGAQVQHKRAIHSSTVLEEGHIEGFNKGNLRIYFWGKITYRDIFEDSHWTNFCFEYIFEHREFYPYRSQNEAN